MKTVSPRLVLLACAALALAAPAAVRADDDDRVRFAPRVVIETRAAYLGVVIEENIEHPEGGARITRVVSGSPAEAAGLVAGDTISRVADRVVRGPGALHDAMREREPGDSLRLTVRAEDGSTRDVQVTLADRKEFSHDYNVAFGEDADRWREWAERLQDQARRYEALGEEMGQMWTEDHARELEERMEKLSERMGEMNFEFVMPDVQFAPDDLPRLFYCDDDDCEDVPFGLRSRRAMLGVQLAQTTPDLREHLGAPRDAGVLVSKVLDDSVARRAGIRVGDLIVAVNGERVSSAGALRGALRGVAGKTVEVELIRDRVPTVVSATFPEADDSGSFGPRAALPTAPAPPAPAAVALPSVRPLAVSIPARMPAPAAIPAPAALPTPGSPAAPAAVTLPPAPPAPPLPAVPAAGRQVAI